MFSQNKLTNEFNDILIKIDSNIKELNYNQTNNNNVIQETNKLISTASLLLLKMNEIINNIPLNEIESKYTELENRKKEISKIINQLNINLLNKIDNKKSDEMDTLLEHNEQPIDVNYLTNYNENLLNGTIKNLKDINENLKETAVDLKNQGNQLKFSSGKMDINLENINEGNRILNNISCNSLCNKIWMFIVNILLFIIILLLIVFKIISYLK